MKFFFFFKKPEPEPEPELHYKPPMTVDARGVLSTLAYWPDKPVSQVDFNQPLHKMYTFVTSARRN